MFLFNPVPLVANAAYNAAYYGTVFALHCTGAGLGAVHTGLGGMPLVGSLAQATMAGILQVPELLVPVSCPEELLLEHAARPSTPPAPSVSETYMGSDAHEGKECSAVTQSLCHRTMRHSRGSASSSRWPRRLC